MSARFGWCFNRLDRALLDYVLEGEVCRHVNLLFLAIIVGLGILGCVKVVSVDDHWVTGCSVLVSDLALNHN
jgi:hypothetical protein